MGLDLITRPLSPQHPDEWGRAVRRVKGKRNMNHLLITQIAQDDIAERVRYAEMERLARMARTVRPVAVGTGLRDRARRLPSVLTSWRHRADQTAARPCPTEPCAEGHAS
jgi:hypothetical protein